MKNMNKKGFVLTVPLLIVAAIILVIIFGGTALTLWMLKTSIFYIIGGAMIILALVFAKALPSKAVVTIIIIGAVLVVLPITIDTLQGLTIASLT